MIKEKIERRNSGQALVITALVISLLIISTFYYVYDVMRARQESSQLSLEEYVLMVKLGSVHTMISSLTNVTNGGNTQLLVENLEAWSSKLKNECSYGYCLLNAYPRNTSPYSSGFHISWGQNGFGISSCYVRFNLTIYGRDLEASFEYSVNVTTSITIQGFYSQGTGTEKHVEILCKVFNEGSPALAENFNVYYQNGSIWIQTQSYSLTDYGNGTYHITFNANILTVPVNVSVGVYDARQIYVQANTTCTEA